MIHLLALVATLAAAAADTPEQFVKRFREACDKKDKAAVLALFYAEGAGSGAGWNQEVAQDFVELKVVDVTILPPDASRDGRFVRHDASAKQNLPAVKTLRIKYGGKIPNGQIGADLQLGQKDGTYYFASEIGASAPAAAAKAGPKSMDALVAALKDAHARKDRDGIYALWYTEGADQNSLTFCASIAKDIVESGIANLSYAAPAKTDVYNAKTGTWVHPNLQVLKRLKIQYAKAASNGMLGMDLDIGMKDGSYYFATSIEEKVSAPPTAAARAAAMPAGPAGDEFSTLMDSCRADASFLCEKEKKKKNVAALRQCLTDNTSALTPKCKAALK